MKYVAVGDAKNIWAVGMDERLLHWNGSAWEEPPVSEKTGAVLAHLDGLVDLLGEGAACREIRKQLLYYFRGTPFGAALKNQATQVKSRADVEVLLAEWAMDQA